MPISQADLEAAVAEARIVAAKEAEREQRIQQMEKLVIELKEDRDKFLRWGVIVLGGAVVSLVTWIFNLIRHT